MTTKLRTQRGERGYCYKCSKITADVFAEEVAKRRLERRSLLMAKTKTVEEELDDLDLDDLDELEDEDVEVEEDEDEDVEEDDEDEEDEDPDEAPKAKKGRKSKSSKKKAAAKPKKSGIGTKEVADAAGVESRTLRAYLRSGGYQPRDEREGRYSWPSLKDPEVREIIKAIKQGAVERMNKQKLADLKEGKAKKAKASGKKSSKKASAKKKRAKK